MNRSTALKLLGFDPTDDPSLEDLNKKFRKLTAKMHPDLNKEDGAEDKFKQISAAYEYLKNPPIQDSVPQSQDQWAGFHRVNVRDMNWGFSPTMFFKPSLIKIRLPLSFKESVLGVKKKMKFQRQVPCASCNGKKAHPTSEVCSVCKGKKVITQQQAPNFQITIPCPNCQGTGHQHEACSSCLGQGTSSQENQVEVQIPGGIQDGSILNLRGVGNIKIEHNQMVVGDVQLIAQVKPEPNMKLSGRNVISSIDISLLEALKGTQKQVKTVLGEKTLTIPPESKHKEEAVLSKHGVEKVGDHIFQLKVSYPQNVTPLIEFLKTQEN